MFGEFNDSQFDASQKFFLILILFLLNVVLLNLLVAIMGNTYDKVKDKEVLTDALTRIDMILDAMALMRIFIKYEEKSEKGYLIYCEPEEAEDEEEVRNNRVDESINYIKEMLNQSEQKSKEISQELVLANKKLDLKSQFEQKLEEKINLVDHRLHQEMTSMTTKLEEVKQEMNRNLQNILDAVKQSHSL